MSATPSVPVRPSSTEMFPHVFAYFQNVFHDFRIGLEVQKEETLKKLFGEDSTISIDSRLDNLRNLQRLVLEYFSQYSDKNSVVEQIKLFCTPNDSRMCHAFEELIAYFRRAYPKKSEELDHLEKTFSSIFKFPFEIDPRPDIQLIFAEIPDVHRHQLYFQSFFIEAIKKDDLKALSKWALYHDAAAFNITIPKYNFDLSYDGTDFNLNLLDVCAAYGAIQCFHFALAYKIEPSEHTLALSVIGGHPDLPYEVQHIVQQNQKNVWKAFYAAIIYHRHELLKLLQEFYQMFDHECNKETRFAKVSPCRIAMMSHNFFAFALCMAFTDHPKVHSLIKTADEFDNVTFNEYFDDIYRGHLKYVEI